MNMETVLETIPSKTIPIVQEVWIQPGVRVKSISHVNNNATAVRNPKKNLCRICALDEHELTSIFGIKGRSLRLASKINKYLPITVNENDKLPTLACQECIDKLEATIQLVSSCVKAQLQLAELLVPKENQDEEFEDLESHKTDESDDVSSDGDDFGVDEMFTPYDDIGEFGSRFESASMESSTQNNTEKTYLASGSGERKPLISELQKSIGKTVSNVQSEVAKGNVDGPSKMNMKKPKFKVVVVKVKNNGKLPDHNQIAQTLRELKLEQSNKENSMNKLEESRKEGSVVVLSENGKPPDDLINEKKPPLENKVKGEVKGGNVAPASPATSKDDESDHSYTHWNQKHEKCEYCSDTFVGRVNLIAHQMKEHKSNVFCCFRCDKVFYDSKAEYDKHVEAHCISSSTRVKKVQAVKDKEVVVDGGNLQSDAELRVTAVARVSVDEDERLIGEQSEGPVSEKAKKARVHKPGLRMKLSKEFEGMDPSLKSKIMGTIQKLVHRSRYPMLRNISCPICKIKFVSVTALETHRRIKHDERLPCRFCSRLCRTEAALKKHESHYHVQEFKCEVCAAEFKSRSHLQKHELKHFGARPFQCNMCEKSYTTRGSLQIHVTTHSSEKPYLCDKCGKGFKHVSNLNAHRRTHSDDPSVVKAHRCPVCSKGFRCQFLVREHMRVHTGDKPFVCEHCGKSFYKKQQLRQHSAVHAPTPMFKCGVCGARFNRKGNMMQHQKRHGKEGVFTCRICGENFSSIGLVLRHRRTHGEEELEVMGPGEGEQDPELAMAYKCDLCCKLLSSKVSLTLHMRTHTGERPYTCGECGKSFSQSTSLKVHERTHTGERPFVCGQCMRGFSSRAALTVHERSHTGERPYRCRECDKSFRCAAALRQHSTTHSDNRPFTCEYCGKKFRRKEALEIHMRTHTGERPYGCKICGRRFAQKGDARKHERTHDKVRRPNSVPDIGLLDDCSDSYENQPMSLVEITTDPESVSSAEQPDSSMHPSLQLEHGAVGDAYSNLPPGTIIINAQDLMTSSSEITVVAEEDLNNHILGNGIAIQYAEEC